MANHIRLETLKDNTYIIKQAFRDRADKAIREACFDIEAGAKQRITDSDAIDTGALRASIYTVTSAGSGYSQASGEAAAASKTIGKHSKRPHSKPLEMLPEERVGPLEGVVAVGAEYGVYVEMGTVHTSARPYFGPAADEVLSALDKAIEKFIEKIDK